MSFDVLSKRSKGIDRRSDVFSLLGGQVTNFEGFCVFPRNRYVTEKQL